MDYSQVISKEHRGLIILAIDQSGSMLGAFRNVSMITTKSEIASMIASTIIEELVLRTKQPYRMVEACPFCDIVVLGYAQNKVYSLIHDSAYVLPITALNTDKHGFARRTIEYVTPDNHLNLVLEGWREWIKPKAVGITPMTDMLYLVAAIVSEWCSNKANQDSFPPVVINITDVLSRVELTKDHINLSNAIKHTGTKYGNTLLFNACIDSCPRSERLQFPNPNDIPKRHPIAPLAAMSSELPLMFYPLARKYNNNAKPPYLGVCYNSLIIDVIAQLNIDIRWDNCNTSFYISKHH